MDPWSILSRYLVGTRSTYLPYMYDRDLTAIRCNTSIVLVDVSTKILRMAYQLTVGRILVYCQSWSGMGYFDQHVNGHEAKDILSVIHNSEIMTNYRKNVDRDEDEVLNKHIDILADTIGW